MQKKLDELTVTTKQSEHLLTLDEAVQIGLDILQRDEARKRARRKQVRSEARKRKNDAQPDAAA